MNKTYIDPIPLGIMLRDEYLAPLGISPYKLAKSIGVTQASLTKIFNGGRITPEMGLMLDAFFGLSEGFWSGLQGAYDLQAARRAIGDRAERLRSEHLSETLRRAA